MRLSPPIADMAVSPLVDLCDDVHSRLIAGGFPDLLARSLKRLPSLRVVVANSRPPTAGHLAAYDVQGFVFGRARGQLQVVLGITNVATTELLLSRSYTGQGPALMRMQAAIAHSLSDEIHAVLKASLASRQAKAANHRVSMARARSAAAVLLVGTGVSLLAGFAPEAHSGNVPADSCGPPGVPQLGLQR